MFNTKIPLHLFLLTLAFHVTASAASNDIKKLKNKSWFSGAENCQIDKSPAIERYQYNQDTFILRQNKCVHYEAPFMYLLFGEKQALLIDTGATKEHEKFPLAAKVSEIMAQRAHNLKLQQTNMPLLVVHSHSHVDHIAGDSQFKNVENVEIIKVKDTKALISSFSFENWPTQNSQIDLGKRVVELIPSPGHQAQAITFYDQQTKWLLTGDSLYPGRLYIKQWQDYKASIKRIVTFTETHSISGILGAHIEMSTSSNIDYPVKSTYQPNETSLVLSVEDLYKLNHQLSKLGEQPTRVGLGNFIIYPIK
jgi:glyoxylase-like metal-dependent hydrolase (beta-lactamase superfamily II)